MMTLLDKYPWPWKVDDSNAVLMILDANGDPVPWTIGDLVEAARRITDLEAISKDLISERNTATVNARHYAAMAAKLQEQLSSGMSKVFDQEDRRFLLFAIIMHGYSHGGMSPNDVDHAMMLTDMGMELLAKPKEVAP